MCANHSPFLVLLLLLDRLSNLLFAEISLEFDWKKVNFSFGNNVDSNSSLIGITRRANILRNITVFFPN